MDRSAIYVGQYKKGTRFIGYNIIRYTTLCLILDYYCYMNVSVGDVINSRDWFIQYVLKQSEIKDTDTNRTIINTVITNMVMIGLLCENRGELIITNNGKQAYIDQTYHMEAASLYEAKESRRLSLIAVVISIVSILLAVMPSITKLVYQD